jgi:hypothetical protein
MLTSFNAGEEDEKETKRKYPLVVEHVEQGFIV